MSAARESHSPAAPDRSSSRRRSTGASEAADQIKVICRFRPPALPQAGAKNQVRSNKKTDESSFKINEDNATVEFSSDLYEHKNFKFDKVFDTNCTQLGVFETVCGVVDSVISGFNGTIMAYGQTSAGKSFTMEGPSLWDTEAQGIMPRCIDMLFQRIEDTDEAIQFQLLVSYYEVYCEKVRDLLNPSSVNLKVRETKADGFVVQDITEVSCTDREEVLRIIELGKANRASAPTLMNAESSRSHSIVSILVDQQDTKTGRQRRGSLFLVDLAGSEKVSKTGAKGMRLEEAKNINSSLTTLGMVINSLCDGSPHVPYRDSKLTQLLMEALGGNRFGERAKRIKNNAKVNEELSPDELKVLLQSARKEVVTLKRRVKKFASVMATSLTEDNLSSVQEQLSSLQALVNDVDGGDDYAGGTRTAAGIATLTPSNSLLGSDSTGDGTPRADIYHSHSGTVSLDVTKELADLNSKIKQLEDELETEKERYTEEHQHLLEISAESTALKATITELEEKLLQSTLQVKRSMMWNNAELSGTGGSAISTRSGYNSMEHSPDPRSGRSISLTQEALPLAGRGAASSLSAVSSPSSSFHAETSSRPFSGQLNASQKSPLSALSADSTSNDAEGYEEATRVDDANDVLPDRARATTDSSQDAGAAAGGGNAPETRKLSTEMTVDELESHGFALRSELEEDLQILTEGFNEKSAEAKHANEIARSYADRYIKLREDYETHVQRLMLKVTQEQQTRIQLEDRLEEALHDATAKPKKSARYFFSGWFSRAGDDYGRRHSVAYGGGGRGSINFDCADSPGMTALEMAQFRIAQLSSELEANKEAQNIVLDTKESVMRSLARQNTELTLEKDALNSKLEELNSKVEQMTSLIRSFQQQQAQSFMNMTPTNGASNMTRTASSYGRSDLLQSPRASGGVLGVGGHNSRVRSVTLTPRAANIIRSGGAFKFGLSTCIAGGQSHDESEDGSESNSDRVHSPLLRAVHRITPAASLTTAAHFFPNMETEVRTPDFDAEPAAAGASAPAASASEGISSNDSSNISSRNSSKQELSQEA